MIQVLLIRLLLLLLWCFIENVINIFGSLSFKQINNDLMRHSIMPNEALSGIFGQISAALDRTKKWRLRWNVFGQHIFKMFVTKMLIKGVSSGKHKITERTFDLQGQV